MGFAGSNAPAPAHERRSRLPLLILAAILLGVFAIGLGLAIFVIEGGSDEHAAATAAAARHPTISQDVGSPIETSLPCWSRGIKDNRGTRGIHSFSVSGPRGEGRAMVELGMSGLAGTPSRTYRVLSVEWTFDGNTRKLDPVGP